MEWYWWVLILGVTPVATWSLLYFGLWRPADREYPGNDWPW